MHIEGNAFLLGKLLWDIKLRGEKGVVFYHENLSPDDQRRLAAKLAQSLNVELALDILTADKSDLFELRHLVHSELEASHPEDIVAAFEFGFELSGYCWLRGGHPNPSNPANQGAKPENIAIVENKLRKRAEDAHVDWGRLETIVAMAKDRSVGTDEFLQATGQTIFGLLEYLERKGTDQPPNEDSKARVFVSHSSKDKPFVRKLVEALRKHLLNIWVDEHEIKVGDSLVGKISEALKDADYLVIVLSKASVSSRWVEQELNASLTNQISGKGVVLPVLLEDCELPMLLRDRLYADFRADFNVGLEALVAAFEHEGEAAADVATLGPRNTAPGSFTPAGLRENLQGLLSDRMTRAEVGRLWYAVLETRMEDEMGQLPKSDFVIELLVQAKNRDKLSRLTEELSKIRPDLINP